MTCKTKRVKRVTRVIGFLSRWRLGLAIGAGILLAIPGALVVTSRPAGDHEVIAVTFAPGEGSPIDWSRLHRRPVRPSLTVAIPAPPAPLRRPASQPNVPLPPRPTPPPPGSGSAQQALINQDRAGSGLPPLAWSPCLAGVALQNAQRMAGQGYISHTNGPTLDLACGLGSWAGENVGYTSGGINDTLLNAMFMNSPEHRANILNPNYHDVGTAWAVAPNGYAYVAVEFS